MSIDDQLAERIARLNELIESLPDDVPTVGTKTTRPERPEIVLYQARPGEWKQGREQGGKIISLATGRPVAAHKCRLKTK